MTASRPDSPAAALSPAALSPALRIIDDAWEELRRSVFAQTQMGLPLTGLPNLTLAEARAQERRRQFARAADRKNRYR